MSCVLCRMNSRFVIGTENGIGFGKSVCATDAERIKCKRSKSRTYKNLRIRYLCHCSNTSGVELQGGAWGGTSFRGGGGICRFSEVSRVPNKTENKNGRS